MFKIDIKLFKELIGDLAFRELLAGNAKLIYYVGGTNKMWWVLSNNKKCISPTRLESLPRNLLKETEAHGSYKWFRLREKYVKLAPYL